MTPKQIIDVQERLALQKILGKHQARLTRYRALQCAINSDEFKSSGRCRYAHEMIDGRVPNSRFYGGLFVCFYQNSISISVEKWDLK